MIEEMIRLSIEWISKGIEILAVLIIAAAIVYGAVRYLFHWNQGFGTAYERYRVQLGKSLLMGLELLVAADIIRTVALNPTLQGVIVLGILVVIRTFLSWSIVVETESRWPWQSVAKRKD